MDRRLAFGARLAYFLAVKYPLVSAAVIVEVAFRVSATEFHCLP